MMNEELKDVEWSTEEGESGLSLDEIINQSSSQHESGPLYGVYTIPLLFDEEHNIFCIPHPYQQDYVIPVSKTTVSINKHDIEKDVLISFNGGDIYQPIVTGKVRDLTPVADEVDLSESQSVSLDGQEKLVFKADKEIVFQCGKSSIHLTSAGKVLIKGAYLLSRSSGVNKIKGGSVQLN